MAFGVSAAFGGVAGSMLMMNRPFASDVQFGLALAIFLVVGLVVGGAGTISGAIPGAMIYVFVPYFMSEWTADQSGMPPGVEQVSKPLFDWLEGRQGAGAIAGVFFGIGLLIFVFLLPGGFVDGMRKLRGRIIHVDAEPVVAAAPHGRAASDLGRRSARGARGPRGTHRAGDLHRRRRHRPRAGRGGHHEQQGESRWLGRDGGRSRRSPQRWG